jgi:hypothetical protein
MRAKSIPDIIGFSAIARQSERRGKTPQLSIIKI